MNRRKLATGGALSLILMAMFAFAIACGGTEIREVEVVKVVEKQVPVEVVKEVTVEKIVIQESIKEVPIEVEVVKEVLRTEIVEKPITKITTKIVVATPTPADASAEVIVPAGTFNGAIANYSPITGWGPSCTACSQLVGASVGEGLFTTARDETGGIGLSPWLVTEWEVSSDGSYSDFTIQEGVQFHQNFGEMTAEDVVWYFNLINTNSNPDSKHDTGVQIFDLEIAEVLEPYKARFHWLGYGGYTLMQEFTDLQEGVEVLSKRAFEEKGQEWMADNPPIATGPYEVQKWVDDEEIRLIAVPDHWSKTPYISRVSILHVGEASTRRAMLESSQSHAAEIGLKDMPAMVADGYKLAPEIIQGHHNLSFNGNYWENIHASTGEALERTRDTSVPWVGDPYEDGDTYSADTASMVNSQKVRKALTQAIDRQLLADTVLSSLGWPITVGHMATDDPLYLKYGADRWSIPYDPAASNALLTDAGFDGGEGLTPRVWTGPSGTAVELWDAIGVMWQTDLGITAEFDRTDYYANHRPAIVARTSTQIHSACCGGMGLWPMEWSYTSGNYPGGYGVGIETPTHTRLLALKKSTSEPADVEALGVEQFDFLHETALHTGVARYPAGAMYNPNTVMWETMRPYQWGKMGGLRSFEHARLLE